MKIVSKILWAISSLGFVLTLFSTYSQLANQVWIGLSTNSQYLISKSAYFYGCIGVMVIFNLLWVSLSNVVVMLPKQFIFVPHRQFWLANRENRQDLNKILQSWVFFTACVTNMFLISILAVLGAVNHIDGNVVFNGQWLFTLSGIMAITLILPIFRLFVEKGNLLDNNTK